MFIDIKNIILLKTNNYYNFKNLKVLNVIHYLSVKSENNIIINLKKKYNNNLLSFYNLNNDINNLFSMNISFVFEKCKYIYDNYKNNYILYENILLIKENTLTNTNLFFKNIDKKTNEILSVNNIHKININNFSDIKEYICVFFFTLKI